MFFFYLYYFKCFCQCFTYDDDMVIVFCVSFIYYLSISFLYFSCACFLYFLMQFSSITISQVSNCHLAPVILVICFMCLMFVIIIFIIIIIYNCLITYCFCVKGLKDYTLYYNSFMRFWKGYCWNCWNSSYVLHCLSTSLTLIKNGDI